MLLWLSAVAVAVGVNVAVAVAVAVRRSRRREGRTRCRCRCSRRNVAVNERGALVCAGDSGAEGSLNIDIPNGGYERSVCALLCLPHW